MTEVSEKENVVLTNRRFERKQKALMTRRFPLFLTIVFLLAVAAPAFAQELETKFDKFENQTTVSAAELEIESNTPPGMRVWLGGNFSFKGKAQQAAVPDGFLFFIMNSRDWRWLRDKEHPVRAMLPDGQIVNLGNASYENRTKEPEAFNTYICVEGFGMTLKRDVFARLVNAEYFDVRVGRDEFRVTHKDTTGLRLIVKQMENGVKPGE
jgi:hypothetical protein